MSKQRVGQFRELYDEINCGFNEFEDFIKSLKSEDRVMGIITDKLNNLTTLISTFLALRGQIIEAKEWDDDLQKLFHSIENDLLLISLFREYFLGL